MLELLIKADAGLINLKTKDGSTSHELVQHNQASRQFLAMAANDPKANRDKAKKEL